MAPRPNRKIDMALIIERTVEAAQTVAVGRLVKDGNADGECQHAAAGEAGIGISLYIGDNANPSIAAGAAGDFVSIVTLNSAAIVPVLVGTGGATRGLKAKAVADGLADAAPDPDSTGATIYTVGTFDQSGVAGDMVGLLVEPAMPTVE